MPVSYADDAMRPLDRVDLWPGRIPCGDISLLFGEGAVGKGRMICDLIARVTTGRPMPLCTDESEPGSVIVVLPEDDPNEQVAHRLRAAGADLSRVFDLTRLDGGSRFKLSADGKHLGDLPHLRALVDKLEADGMNPRLVVIDPLAAVLGWGTIQTNAGARRLVEPLQDMAKDTGVAVLAVAHTVKSGALQGSAGLPQALRTVYRIARDKDNPALRVLSVEKANNLPPTEDIRYAVAEDENGSVRVVWQDRETLEAQRMNWRERLAARKAERDAGAPLTPAPPVSAPLRPVRASAPSGAAATYTAVMAVNRGSQVLARGTASLELAQTVCQATPQARMLAQHGTLLDWRQHDGRTWRAGNSAVGFAVIAEGNGAVAV